MPIIITQAEFMRRWKDMQQLSGQQAFMPQMESYNMVINSNHPLMGKILSENDEGKKQELSKQIVDLALLSQNILKGEALTEFVKRSVNLIAEE
jgi:molecular chaperone HtpG